MNTNRPIDSDLDDEFDNDSTQLLIKFFELLHQWDTNEIPTQELPNAHSGGPRKTWDTNLGQIGAEKPCNTVICDAGPS